MIDSYENLKLMADWLTAIGTIFLGIVALFVPQIDRWWRRPELTMSSHPRFTHDHDQHGNPRILVLLCVENKRGVAENAEVFLQSVTHNVDDGINRIMDNIVPMSLRWYHREVDKPDVFLTVSRGMQRYLILGGVTQRSGEEDRKSATYFQLYTEHKFDLGSDELPPGQYTIVVLIAASSVKPKVRRIRLTVPPAFEEPKVVLI